MKSLDMIDKLRKLAVFSAADIERLSGKSRQHAYLYLARLRAKGTIYEIENGKYTCHTDSFLIASRIIWPSYISGFAALQFHNMTEQLPNSIEVVTTRSRKNRKLNFMNSRIEFSRVKPSGFFGYEKIEYQKQHIFIADKEKSLIDAFFLKHISPSEFQEILANKRSGINMKRLKSYSRRVGKSLLKKIEKLVDKNDR